MSEMIEQVAKFLHALSAEKFSSSSKDAPIYGPWEQLSDHNRLQYFDYARAAVKAMRDPTPEMYDALSATDILWKDNTSQGVWQAMIDGALK